jgi:hypothetical protein
VVLCWVDIPPKERYLVFDTSLVIYVCVIDVEVLDARRISVGVTIIVGDIKSKTSLPSSSTDGTSEPSIVRR